MKENKILGYQLFSKGEYFENKDEIIRFGLFAKETTRPVAVATIEFPEYRGEPQDYDGEYNAIRFLSDFFSENILLNTISELGSVSNGKMLTTQQVIECLENCGYQKLPTRFFTIF